MTQINWQYQVNNRAGGYVVTATDWNDFAGNFRAFIDQTTGSGTTDNSPLPIGIDLVNDRVYISDPDSTTPEDANHADTTLSVVGTTTLAGNTQQTGTFTVGVDDTGHDVKFFGATAGAYLEWDESADNLIAKNSKVTIQKDSAAPIVSIEAFHDTETTAGVLQFTKADGSAASPALVDDDAMLGKIVFYGYDGNSYAAGAQIYAQVDGTPADGDMPSSLIFQVTPDGGSETPATALTIFPDKKAQFDTPELMINSGANVTPDANWDGQLSIQADGYQGGIAMDGTAMWVGHNSSARHLYLATNETARVIIDDGTGILTKPYTPAFRVSKTGSGTEGQQGAAVFVCNTASGTGCYNNGSHFNTTSGMFTAPVDGYYFFSWSLFLHTSYDNDTDCYFGIYSSNGSLYTNHGDKGVDGGQGIAGIFYLDASDTAYPYVVSSGLDITSFTGQSYNSFQGFLLG